MSPSNRVLVVDDDEPIRTLLTKLLEQQNLSVDTARDGSEAIRRLDSDRYRLVLLDLMMPKVDGWAVLRHMSRHYPENLQRTIIASALPAEEISRQLTDEVFRVHRKPFDVTQLIADIRTCVAA